jgi:hypothetical protein
MQDRVKNITSEAILGLLFGSLLVIYLVVPPGDLVTFLCVITLAISLIIALTGDWSDLIIVGVFAAIVSLVAAYFLGRSLRLGAVGGLVLPILWLGVLALAYRWIMRHRMIVPNDRVVLVRSPYTRGIYTAPPPPIRLPGDRIVAVIPLYNLSSDVEIKKVNTSTGYDILLIAAHMHFRVTGRLDAKKVLTSLINRDQEQTDLAREMGKPVYEARGDLVFWEKLIIRLVDTTTEDIVREVIFEQGGKPVDAYKRREELAKESQRRLNARVHHWGLQITLLDFERLELDPERFKAAFLEQSLERETRVERIKAEREAARVKLILETEVDAEARRVTSIINALRDSGIDITADVVLRAMRATSDWVMEGDYTLLPPPAPPTPPAPKPSGDRKDSGARKP